MGVVPVARSIVRKTARLEALLAEGKDRALRELARRVYGRNAGGRKTQRRVATLKYAVLRRRAR